MGYVEHAPPPSLASLVACYWAVSGPYDAHRVLPDGCIDILVTAGGLRVVGTMSKSFVAPPSATPALGIRFHPGEAARLLPEVDDALTDGTAPLESPAFASHAARLVDGLFERPATSAHAVLTRAAPSLDAALVAWLGRSGGAVDRAVREAVFTLTSGGTVAEAARRANLSERQLARRFTRRVGVAPKSYGRIARLARAVAALDGGLSASAAAALAGYADQAHFTRDATALAGLPPTLLRAERSGRAPITTDSFKTAHPTVP